MTIKEMLFGSDRLTAKQEQMRQLALYPLAGVFTALANAFSFILMNMILYTPVNVEIMGRAFDLTLIIKQLVSWVATIITAYTTNRIFVFRSHGNFVLELLGFAAARLSTFLLIEIALFSFMVMWMENRLGIDQDHVLIMIGSFEFTSLYIVKFLNNVVLVVFNFILSKWLVFKNTSKYQEHKEKGNLKDDKQ